MALEDTAQRLINKFGRTASLVRKLAPSDPAAPWDADVDAPPVPVKMVFTSTENVQADPTNIQPGATGALVAGLDVALIETGDKIIDGADEWQVKEANPVQPGSTLFIWKLVLAH